MEWGIVAIVAVAVIFAGSKLPQLARNVGRAQGEFKKGLREGATADDTSPTPPSTPAAEQPKPAEQPPAD
ncbi:MAG TPA: twin-arginine translocase TatA/TatE family subunit [Actinomycetota bacterium]